MSEARPQGANPLMPDERPATVFVDERGKEHFRCLPFATTLAREPCAQRFVHAAKLRRTPDGIKGPKLGEVTASQRQLGYGRHARCRDCPVGMIHAAELGTVAKTGHERQRLERVDTTMPKHSEEMPGWARGWKADGLTVERTGPGEPVIVGWDGKKFSAAAWGREIGIGVAGFIKRVRDHRAGKITIEMVFGTRRAGGNRKKRPREEAQQPSKPATRARPVTPTPAPRVASATTQTPAPAPQTTADLAITLPGDLLRALGYDVTEMVVPAGRVLFVRG